MKSAADWWDSLPTSERGFYVDEKIIKAIQADALREAAEIAGLMTKDKTKQYKECDDHEWARNYGFEAGAIDRVRDAILARLKEFE